MLRWSIIFLIIAVLAALFGLSGLADDSWHIGQFVAIANLILAAGCWLLHRRSKLSGPTASTLPKTTP